jgi:hypothetical protein
MPHDHLGKVPPDVAAPVQYGPNVQALAVYLHQGHLLPLARTCQVLTDLCGCQLCEGTVVAWVEQAGAQLAPTVERIAELIASSPLQHGDETGIRVYGMLFWLHVNCTRWLTHLSWHAARGTAAMDEIGIWPRFTGRGVHDRWASYDAYACAHSICGAHLLRDCAGVAEQYEQGWAAEMHDFLLDLYAACHEWRLAGVGSVPPSSAMSGWLASSRSWLLATPPSPLRLVEHLLSEPAGPNKARPRTCSMPCSPEPSKSWPSSTTSRFLLRTTRPSAICGWRKCSKRWQALFAVRPVLPLFAASAVICLPCRSRGILCWLHSPLCSMVNLCRSLGDLSSY